MSIVTGGKKRQERLYFSKRFSLDTSSPRILSLSAGTCGLYFCPISGNTFGTVCNHRSLGKLSARVSRGGRVVSGEGGRGGDRGGGHMQQVVRFSKPIEIDGFPIPWQTLSLSLSGASFSRTSLQYTEAFIDIAAGWKERPMREWDERGKSMAGNEGAYGFYYCIFTLSRLLASTLFTSYRTSSYLPPLRTSLRYTHRSDPLAWATV